MTAPAPPVLLLSKPQVESLLPMDECIEAVAAALSTLARGESVQPLRSATWLPDRRGLLGTMPGMSGGESPTLGIKIVTVFPGNRPSADGEATALPSHQGVVLVFDARRGNLTAILDAESITALRTAAASAVATRALAREDASTLALLGSGVQAETHLEAIRLVRPIRRVRVWSRTTEHARAFAEQAAEKWGLAVEAVSDPPTAVEDADIVCTVTGASEPVLHGAWLAPGTHVNAVGACTPNARELDTEAVRRARLYVDRRESCQAESGDFLIPQAAGALGEEHIVGELGELLLGEIPGRSSPDEITLFESLGLAVEDLAAADRVVRKALDSGLGQWVTLG